VRRIAISFLITLAAGSVLPATAATKHIGVAAGKGDIRVDKTSMQGNATLFSGATVETGEAVSSLTMTSGAEYQLGPRSFARVYEDKVVLERGTAELRNGNRGGLGVGSVSIRPSSGGSLLRVTRSGDGLAQVSALSGGASVFAAGGELIASVPSGLGLAFDPQSAGAAPPVKLHGLLSASNGKYYVTDCQSGKSMELVGEDVAQWVGKTVEVSGSVFTGENGSVFRGAWFGASNKACHIAAVQSKDAVAKPGKSSSSRSVLASKTTWVIVGGAGAAALGAGFVSSGSDPVSR
jgi:hypothetical protein